MGHVGGIPVIFRGQEEPSKDLARQADPAPPAAYQNGLLQRPLNEASAYDYIIQFSAHGKAMPPKLPAECRSMLQL